MPKRAPELTAGQVRRKTRPGLHAVGGVAGLVLQVTKPPEDSEAEYGSRSWVLRAMVAGRRRTIGLGPFPDVTLAEAREQARTMKQQIRDGIDPLEQRNEARQALATARASSITFDEAAKRYLAAKRHEFSNPKHVKQWETTLATYASPVVGSTTVADISLAHIVEILDPIWYEKTETASRLRGRIENVLAWATTSGFRRGDNPARWRGHLDTVLPKPSKVAKVQHHRALPFTEIGGFVKKLREREGMAARALEFAILTATRSGEVRHATWDEIDLQDGVWTIPADRMKAGREHRVPLTDDALAILKALPRFAGSSHVFPSARGGPLSDATLSAVLRRMDVDATPHGFRSTFRDWAAERTSYAHEVVEAALAHSISDKVERAYRRGDLFRKRHRLMRDWATYCRTVERGGNVTSIRDAQPAQ